MENKYSYRRGRVLLAGCQLPAVTNDQFYYSMMELKALTETAGGECAAEVTQKRERIHPATYIGKGKLQQMSDVINDETIDLVIFNDELSPSQMNNISSVLETPVIDRTQLILDIFAGRANSKEGKLQVELAQLKYMLPLLSGKGEAMSRLGAGIGTRGPGETKLEKDRRHIRRRITEIERSLEGIVHHRERYRDRRSRNRSVQVSLVGYTNAGKSTLFNHMTEAGTFEENQLFATLDPLTRKLRLPAGFGVLLTDTVGFIQDLPTTLVAAFRSTLEEVKEADLILHIVDASHPDHEQHEQTVLNLLTQLKADRIPVLTVYNKMDQVDEVFIPQAAGESIQLSAKNHEDVDKLQQKVQGLVKELMVYYDAQIPATEGKLLASLKAETLLTEKQLTDDGSQVRCKGYMLPELPLFDQLKSYKSQ